MTLAIGSHAPDFELSNQFGETVRLSEELKKGPVALVFFPFAFSGICTGELCELRDNLNMFADSSVQLMGISVDTKYALKAWAEQENYQFTLLADFWPHGAVASEYGVFLPDLGFSNRATFVIGRDGVIRAAFVTAPGEARDLEAYREAVAAVNAA